MSTILSRSRSDPEINKINLRANDLPSSSFTRVHNRLFLALSETELAQRIAQHELQRRYLVVEFNSVKKSSTEELSDEFIPCSLEEIYRFDQKTRALLRRHSDLKIVYASGAGMMEQLDLVFLMGCHLIMTHGVESEIESAAFAHLNNFLDAIAPNSAMRNCWTALHCAKSMGWVDFREPFEGRKAETSSIEMDEYLHYARRQNGEIYSIVPDQLILFRAPDTTLPPGATWMDVNGERLFSPTFYAELFDDMGVSLVINLDDADYDRAPFEDTGIPICTLEDIGFSGVKGPGGAVELSLQMLDRFMAVMSAARGPVAVHCDAAAAGHACTLITAFAMKRRYFPAPADAVAWLRMARPGRPVAVEHSFLEQHALRRLRFSRARSSSYCADGGDDRLGPQPAAAGPAMGGGRVSPAEMGPDGWHPPAAAGAAALAAPEPRRGPSPPAAPAPAAPGFFRDGGGGRRRAFYGSCPQLLVSGGLGFHDSDAAAGGGGGEGGDSDGAPVTVAVL